MPDLGLSDGARVTVQAYRLLRVCRRHQNIRLSNTVGFDRADADSLLRLGYLTEHDGLLTITGSGKRYLRCGV